MGGLRAQTGCPRAARDTKGWRMGVGLFNILLCAYVYTFIQLSAFSDFLSHSCRITARNQAS